VLSLLVVFCTGRANSQSLSESDGDGVIDALDNCIEAPNGVNDPGVQADSYSDEFGNAGDADDDHDNRTTILDFPRSIAELRLGVSDRVTDHSGDGQTNLLDFGTFIPLRQAGVPGPSGLHCAGLGGVCEAHEEGGPIVSEQEATENDLALLAEAKGFPLQDVRRRRKAGGAACVDF
jgi:hypothetical protein